MLGVGIVHTNRLIWDLQDVLYNRYGSDYLFVVKNNVINVFSGSKK